jgi:hypothetical protein
MVLPQPGSDQNREQLALGVPHLVSERRMGSEILKAHAPLGGEQIGDAGYGRCETACAG